MSERCWHQNREKTGTLRGRTILTKVKSVWQHYLSKAQDLLADKDTYRPTAGDSTIRHRNKFIQTLRTIKSQGRQSDSTYKRLYPTSAVPPNFVVFPKSINVAPSQDHCFQQGCSNIWHGHRVG